MGGLRLKTYSCAESQMPLSEAGDFGSGIYDAICHAKRVRYRTCGLSQPSPPAYLPG